VDEFMGDIFIPGRVFTQPVNDENNGFDIISIIGCPALGKNIEFVVFIQNCFCFVLHSFIPDKKKHHEVIVDFPFFVVNYFIVFSKK
jgi:hypothetical protein